MLTEEEIIKSMQATIPEDQAGKDAYKLGFVVAKQLAASAERQHYLNVIKSEKTVVIQISPESQRKFIVNGANGGFADTGILQTDNRLSLFRNKVEIASFIPENILGWWIDDEPKIETEEQNDSLIAQLEALHDRGNLSAEEEAWAERVTAAIEAFEEEHYAFQAR